MKKINYVTMPLADYKFSVINYDLNNMEFRIDKYKKFDDKLKFKITKDNNVNNKLNCSYKEMAIGYYTSSIHIMKYIQENNFNNKIVDEYSIPMLYLIRHGIELIIKASILKEKNDALSVQKIFQENKHDLFKLYSKLSDKNDSDEWLKKYLESISLVDPSEDLFRYSMSKENREKYTFINSYYTMIISIYAFDIILRKYYNESFIKDDDISKFKEIVDKYSPLGEVYLILENHGMGNMYNWQTDNLDLYKQINGFKNSSFIISKIINDYGQDLNIQMLFLLRHSLELSLKDLINRTHTYFKEQLSKEDLKNIPDKAYPTHSLKELWNYVERIIEELVSINNWPIEPMKIMKMIINYIEDFDKQSDYLRYPTNKGLKYYDHENINFDKAIEAFLYLLEVLESIGYVIDEISDSIDDTINYQY